MRMPGRCFLCAQKAGQVCCQCRVSPACYKVILVHFIHGKSRVPRWGGWSSKPDGAVKRSRVGSTPILFRQNFYESLLPISLMLPESFRDALPSDRCYDPKRDMWVKLGSDGNVEIGATALGLFLAGSVIAFTPKPKGAEVDRGRGLGTIETGKTVLAVHCPVSIRLVESNDAAEASPALLEQSPYEQGWMVRGAPGNWEIERADMVDAITYRDHCLAVVEDAEITLI